MKLYLVLIDKAFIDVNDTGDIGEAEGFVSIHLTKKEAQISCDEWNDDWDKDSFDDEEMKPKAFIKEKQLEIKKEVI